MKTVKKQLTIKKKSPLKTGTKDKKTAILLAV